MTVVLDTPWLTVHHADARLVLDAMEPDSIDAVVTSPPYWQQRAYLPPDDPDRALEIGQERTFMEWQMVMVDLCRQLRRVLKPEGSLWLVLGDRYVAYGGERTLGHRTPDSATEFRRKVPYWRVRPDAFPGGLRRKSLLLAPYRLAIALEEDGWILRDRIVWNKGNALPESVGDRLHVRDEVILRFTRERFAYWDAEAIREPYSASTVARHAPGRAPTFAGRKHHAPGQPARTPRPSLELLPEPAGDGKVWTGDVAVDGHRQRYMREGKVRSDGKNPGNVWTIATASRPGNRFDHFAMFPPELVRRPILATCPRGGVVLDPFAGTGTVGQVANELLRRAVLVELAADSVQAILEVRAQRQPIVEPPARAGSSEGSRE